MSLRLIIEDYEGETTIVPLNEGKAPVTVGREDNNTIQLTEQNVSRNHARLSFEKAAWSLEDLESYNGVRVNGIMIDEPIPLQEGDVIQIGDYRLLLSAAEKRRSFADDEALTAANGTQTRAGGSGRLPTLTSTELHSMISDTVTSDRGRSEDDIKTYDGSREAVTQRNPIIKPSELDTQAANDTARVTPSQEVAGGVEVDTPAANQPRSASSGKSLAIVGLLVVLLGGGAAFHFLGPGLSGSGDTQGDGAGKQGLARGQQLSAQGGAAPDDHGADDLEDLGDSQGAGGQDSGSARGSKARSGSDARPRSRKPKVRRPGVAKDQLQRAREASLAGDQARAYRLAKESYGNDPTPASLQLMGLAACKLGRRNSARSAYKRMRKAEHRRLLHQVCASNGIDLG